MTRVVILNMPVILNRYVILNRSVILNEVKDLVSTANQQTHFIRFASNRIAKAR